MILGTHRDPTVVDPRGSPVPKVTVSSSRWSLSPASWPSDCKFTAVEDFEASKRLCRRQALSSQSVEGTMRLPLPVRRA